MYFGLLVFRTISYFSVFTDTSAVYPYIQELLRYFLNGILLLIGICSESLKSHRLNRSIYYITCITLFISVIFGLAQSFGILQASLSYGLSRPFGISAEPRFYAASILPLIIIFSVKFFNSLRNSFFKLVYLIPAGYTLWLASSTYLLSLIQI